MAFLLIAGAIVLIVLILLVRRATGTLATRQGKVLALVVLGLLPIMWLGGAMTYTDAAMKKVDFCVQCHSMVSYGESLHADDDWALSAVHYQNNLVDREKACYVCHTSYVAFGGLKAKLRGLRHVQAHYLGGHEGEIALYQPYDNADCLRCHGVARSFLEGSGHQGFMDELRSGETSCLECHDEAHYFEDDDA